MTLLVADAAGSFEDARVGAFSFGVTMFTLEGPSIAHHDGICKGAIPFLATVVAGTRGLARLRAFRLDVAASFVRHLPSWRFMKTTYPSWPQLWHAPVDLRALGHSARLWLYQG